MMRQLLRLQRCRKPLVRKEDIDRITDALNRFYEEEQQKYLAENLEMLQMLEAATRKG